MIRKQKVKEICDRYNLEQFIKMDFKLEIGPESAYFVLKNRIKKKMMESDYLLVRQVLVRIGYVQLVRKVIIIIVGRVV